MLVQRPVPLPSPATGMTPDVNDVEDKLDRMGHQHDPSYALICAIRGHGDHFSLRDAHRRGLHLVG